LQQELAQAKFELAAKTRELAEAWKILGGKENNWIEHSDEGAPVRRDQLTLASAILFRIDAALENGMERDAAELREQLALKRAEQAERELAEAKAWNDAHFCHACLNTGKFDSDGFCGNCDLGRAKAEAEALRDALNGIMNYPDIRIYIGSELSGIADSARKG
jgi:hypothetical protein